MASASFGATEYQRAQDHGQHGLCGCHWAAWHLSGLQFSIHYLLSGFLQPCSTWIWPGTRKDVHPSLPQITGDVLLQYTHESEEFRCLALRFDKDEVLVGTSQVISAYCAPNMAW